MHVVQGHLSGYVPLPEDIGACLSLPVHYLFKLLLRIISSQMRVDLPFPSMNGWAMFISTYLAMISSKVDSGIFSITGRMASRYRQLAKRKFPLEIFKVRICPAKLYSPSNRYCGYHTVLLWYRLQC